MSDRTLIVVFRIRIDIYCFDIVLRSELWPCALVGDPEINTNE